MFNTLSSTIIVAGAVGRPQVWCSRRPKISFLQVCSVRMVEPRRSPMVGKPARKAEASGEYDYDAVRRVCREAPPAEGGDLGAKLDDALKSGWSIEALKAYAFSVWRDPGCDHVTDAGWRLSVEFADSNGCGGGRDFLKRFKAEPERIFVRKATRRHATPRRGEAQ
jgi:hypothetical protein